jgi:hypothetical protein
MPRIRSVAKEVLLYQGEFRCKMDFDPIILS